MCLAIPTKIIQIQGNLGLVELGGLKKEIRLDLVPDAKIGDYVLLHAGFAIQILNQDEAEKTLKILEELNAVSG